MNSLYRRKRTWNGLRPWMLKVCLSIHCLCFYFLLSDFHVLCWMQSCKIFIMPGRYWMDNWYHETGNDDGDSPSIYLCGNSLGVQPKGVRKYIDAYLRSWAIKGVRGHFDTLSDTPFSTYLDADTTGSELLAPLVGASPSEVALMGTLTGNLHLLMASFYRPTKEKFKIIMEGRAFPSDHVCCSFSTLPLSFGYLTVAEFCESLRLT